MSDILGATATINVQGEVQQKLDVYANDALLHCLGVRESVGMLASEENEQPLLVAPRLARTAKYAVVFDPLDGSSNIDVNVSVGTIFSILRRPDGVARSDAGAMACCSRACEQIAAGYVVYGSSTMLVYSAGNGVHGFTLDPAIGAYVLSHPNIRMPEQGKYYSVNEANLDTFPPAYRQFLSTGCAAASWAQRTRRATSARWSPTFTARCSKAASSSIRPPTRIPRGKLRLLYEANPIAFIAEQAGGLATDGQRRILDIQPESIHQRTPLVVGSRTEMEDFARLWPSSPLG